MVARPVLVGVPPVLLVQLSPRRMHVPFVAALLAHLMGCSDGHSTNGVGGGSAGAGVISAGGATFFRGTSDRPLSGGGAAMGDNSLAGARTGNTNLVTGGNDTSLASKGGAGGSLDASGGLAVVSQAGFSSGPVSQFGGRGGTSTRGATGTTQGGTTAGSALSKGGAPTGGAKHSGGTTTGGMSYTGAASTGGVSHTGGASTGTTVTQVASSFTGDFPAAPTGIADTTFRGAGETRSVSVYKPASAGDNAPLFIFYHGTGGDPYGFISELGAESVASQRGFIIAAPQAVANRMGGPADPDHWESIEFATGWNLSDKTPDANDDIQLTRAIINAAARAYGINTKRVYTLGFSNGAFFSSFAAFLLPNEIAGFAENSGGAIRCANRGEYDAQWVGNGSTCAALAQETGYPNCSGPLKPAEVPAGRVPRGYLVHSNDDLTVSVAWTCTLATAMGSQATTSIVRGQGHAIVPNLVSQAWTNLSPYSLP